MENYIIGLSGLIKFPISKCSSNLPDNWTKGEREKQSGAEAFNSVKLGIDGKGGR